MVFLPFAIHVIIPARAEVPVNRMYAPFVPRLRGVGRYRRLHCNVDYWAAARIGMCDLRNVRTRLIVRCFNSSGSFHGNTVISAFGASDATSIEVCSGCPGTSSGSTSIGVRQFRMKSRDTLYRKSGCTEYRLCRYFSIVSIDTSGRRLMKSGTQLSLLCRYMTVGFSGRWPTLWQKTAAM